MVTAETVTIQGTFDIAKARNMLRKLVNTWDWPLTFGTSASAVLTALGELILHCQQSQSEATAIAMTVVSVNGETHLEISSSIHVTANNNAVERAIERVHIITDHAEINHAGAYLTIRLLLRVN